MAVDADLADAASPSEVAHDLGLVTCDEVCLWSCEPIVESDVTCFVSVVGAEEVVYCAAETSGSGAEAWSGLNVVLCTDGSVVSPDATVGHCNVYDDFLAGVPSWRSNPVT